MLGHGRLCVEWVRRLEAMVWGGTPYCGCGEGTSGLCGATLDVTAGVWGPKCVSLVV